MMKKWRDKITQTRDIINSLVKTLNRIQIYSSIVGALSLISGVITDTPSYLMLSLVPFIVTGTLALVKRRI